MANPDSAHGKLWLWLDERIGLGDMAKLVKKKEVPLHRHSFWYYFGGMTLFLFVVQVLTGILLLLYYRPSAGEAFESIQFIMTEVEFGWLVRSIGGGDSGAPGPSTSPSFDVYFSTFDCSAYCSSFARLRAYSRLFCWAVS